MPPPHTGSCSLPLWQKMLRGVVCCDAQLPVRGVLKELVFFFVLSPTGTWHAE